MVFGRLWCTLNGVNMLYNSELRKLYLGSGLNLKTLSAQCQISIPSIVLSFSFSLDQIKTPFNYNLNNNSLLNLIQRKWKGNPFEISIVRTSPKWCGMLWSYRIALNFLMMNTLFTIVIFTLLIWEGNWLFQRVHYIHYWLKLIGQHEISS